MSALGDLLELLYSAPRSYETLEAEFRVWRHEERAEEAYEAAAAASPGIHATLPAVSGEDEPDPPEETEGLVRIWLERPDRVRVERVGGDDVVPLFVQVGRRYWSYSEDWGAVSDDLSDDVYSSPFEELSGLIDPAPYIGLLELEPGGRAERAGHQVLRARAVPRTDRRAHAFEDFDELGEGADEYLLEVDATRGIILRVEARRDGLPFSIVEAIRVSYDEPISPRTFAFESPEGEPIRTREEISPAPQLHIPLHEAARSAPFRVFAPSTVPADWILSVVFLPASERPAVPARVILQYRSGDASASLMIVETAIEGQGDFDAVDDARTIEDIQYGGLEIRLRRRTEERPQIQLTLTKEATAIEMFSSDVDADTLVELASRLVPAPETGPEV